MARIIEYVGYFLTINEFIMKREKLFIWLALAAIVVTMLSCTTSQTITIKGSPGARIYTPINILLGSIDQKGKVKVKLESDNYYAFLLSQKQGSDELVPFALDYKNCDYMGERVATAVGEFFAIAGLGTMAGGVYSGCTDGDTGWYIAGIGAGIGLIAAGMADIYGSRLKQTQRLYRFKYMSYHTTNDDLSFVRPIPSGEKRRPVASSRGTSRSYSEEDGNSSSARSRNLSERSSRSVKSFSKDVEGDYVGVGKLQSGNETVEDFKKAKVIITSVDKNTVSVDVLDDSGEPFFNKPSNYTVKKGRQGNYTLTHQSISSATITISNGKLTYSHPRVNIDGDIYKLTVNGSKVSKETTKPTHNTFSTPSSSNADKWVEKTHYSYDEKEHRHRVYCDPSTLSFMGVNSFLIDVYQDDKKGSSPAIYFDFTYWMNENDGIYELYSKSKTQKNLTITMTLVDGEILTVRNGAIVKNEIANKVSALTILKDVRSDRKFLRGDFSSVKYVVERLIQTSIKTININGCTIDVSRLDTKGQMLQIFRILSQNTNTSFI